MWILAGIGFGSLTRLADGAVKHGVVVITVAALALPVLQLARNYSGNDHHRRTYEIRYFEALFNRLEARAAIVTESYAVDQLVLYKLAGEHAGGDRTIRLITRDVETVRQHAAAGFATYAFADGRNALESHGFRFEPIQLAATGQHAETIDMSPLPLFRLTKVTSCQDIGNTGWQDITNVARDGRLLIRIDNYRPFESVVALYAGQQADIAAVPLLAVSHGPEAPAMAVTSFQGADAKLDAALQRDAVIGGDRLQRMTHVEHVELKVNDWGDFSWSALDLRVHPDIVLARASVDLNNPRRAGLCGWSGRDFFESGTDERLSFGSSGENSFGAGWHGPERSNEGVDFRWTSAREAEVLIPLTKLGTITVRVRAAPFTYAGSARLTMGLKINDQMLAARPMETGVGTYEWIVPAEAWHEGFNRLAVMTSHVASPAAIGLSSDSRSLGVAVSDLSLHFDSRFGITAALSGQRSGQHDPEAERDQKNAGHPDGSHAERHNLFHQHHCGHRTNHRQVHHAAREQQQHQGPATPNTDQSVLDAESKGARGPLTPSAHQKHDRRAARHQASVFERGEL